VSHSFREKEMNKKRSWPSGNLCWRGKEKEVGDKKKKPLRFGGGGF